MHHTLFAVFGVRDHCPNPAHFKLYRLHPHGVSPDPPVMDHFIAIQHRPRGVPIVMTIANVVFAVLLNVLTIGKGIGCQLRHGQNMVVAVGCNHAKIEG